MTTTLPPDRRPPLDATATPWDLGQATLPQAERCRHTEPDPDDAGVRLMTNVCPQPITLEQRRSTSPNALRLDTLDSGQTLATRATPRGGWRIMAVCPAGYRSSVPVTVDNITAISDSAYDCVRG